MCMCTLVECVYIKVCVCTSVCACRGIYVCMYEYMWMYGNACLYVGVCKSTVGIYVYVQICVYVYCMCVCTSMGKCMCHDLITLLLTFRHHLLPPTCGIQLLASNSKGLVVVSGVVQVSPDWVSTCSTEFKLCKYRHSPSDINCLSIYLFRQ